MRLFKAGVALALLIGASACEVNVNEGNEAAPASNQAAAPPVQNQLAESNPEAIERARQLALGAGSEAQRAQARAQAKAGMQGLRFLVDLSDRELRVFQGDRLVQTHPAAVGTEEWPTPTGEWQFHRVDLNPEWIPPKEEEWAEEEERKAPGDPENPMGQARLVYRMPNSVHGTSDLNSLGKASSHGSVRVANAVAIDLAEMLLKAGGSWEGPQWFQQMVQNRTTEYQIDMADKVPIEVQE